MYWQLTPDELKALLREINERERREREHQILCAGLAASAIYNVHRKRGARAVRPEDFLKKEEPVKVLTPAQFASRMLAFAEEHNRRVRLK